MSDKIHRFIFDTHGIRGELVNLTDSATQMISAHNYPEPLQALLQQAAAVGVLLATTLKFEGKMSIQLQTPGNLKMLVVQTTHDLGYRGLIRYNEAASYQDVSFSELTQNGQMSITIEPEKGKRYQGIVPLNGDSLAACVESYFNQSEQLKTRIWLFNNAQQTFGLMLQALPDMQSEESFEHLVYLASTLTAQECLSEDGETILHRLFHQESVRGLAVDEVKFNCGCSETKMLNSIKLLPEAEIQEVLADKGHLAVRCEFCSTQFKFSAQDLALNASVEGNKTQH
ncbi:Hsp33 family molecular chaperone HslO [Aliikangiella sp. IMCC44653]